jgi:hypothetical protein
MHILDKFCYRGCHYPQTIAIIWTSDRSSPATAVCSLQHGGRREKVQGFIIRDVEKYNGHVHYVLRQEDNLLVRLRPAKSTASRSKALVKRSIMAAVTIENAAIVVRSRGPRNAYHKLLLISIGNFIASSKSLFYAPNTNKQCRST